MFGKPQADKVLDRISPYFNIGGLFDVPTSHFVKGHNGQWYGTGGLGPITSEGGPPNSFKTELALWMFASALNTFHKAGSKLSVYDSENSLGYARFEKLLAAFPNLKDLDFTSHEVTETVLLSNQSIEWLDEWHARILEWAKVRSKLTNKEDPVYTTPFLGFDDTPIKMRCPHFALIDSITKAQVKSVITNFGDIKAGSSEGNTEHMNDARAKAKLITGLNRVNVMANIQFGMVAHENKSIDMGGMYDVKEAGIPHAKKDHKFTGASKAFSQLANGLFEIQRAGPLKNGDGSALYPDDVYDNVKGAIDLNQLPVKIIRNKAGASGTIINVIVSQKDGVLGPLTCFYYIKEVVDGKFFGISGNNVHYHLDLYPEVTINRKTVRHLLSTDPKLARATEITAQLAQYYELHKTKPSERPSPKELYEGLKEKGYDWDRILDSTCIWTFLETQDQERPYLSIKDIVEIYHDRLDLPHFKVQ